jgi:hypothetical protein
VKVARIAAPDGAAGSGNAFLALIHFVIFRALTPDNFIIW